MICFFCVNSIDVMSFDLNLFKMPKQFYANYHNFIICFVHQKYTFVICGAHARTYYTKFIRKWTFLLWFVELNLPTLLSMCGFLLMCVCDDKVIHLKLLNSCVSVFVDLLTFQYGILRKTNRIKQPNNTMRVYVCCNSQQPSAIWTHQVL